MVRCNTQVEHHFNDTGFGDMHLLPDTCRPLLIFLRSWVGELSGLDKGLLYKLKTN
jgi:hypothetical protein